MNDDGSYATRGVVHILTNAYKRGSKGGFRHASRAAGTTLRQPASYVHMIYTTTPHELTQSCDT
jgi:hypothetical protein